MGTQKDTVSDRMDFSCSDNEHEEDGQKPERAPASWMITVAREEFDILPRHRINTSVSGSTLVRFRSPAAHRLQLRSTSCAIWFPEDLCVGFAEAFSFMTSQAPTTPSLAIALDASTLIQVGQERRDMRMVLEGQKMYCDALKFLRAALAEPASKRSDALFGAIMVLQVAEANMVMLGSDWRNHTAGLAAFMRDRVDDEKAAHFGWSRLVERQFATFQLWDGLFARRATEEKFLMADAPALLHIAESVPGVLQECDEVYVGDCSEDKVRSVLSRLKDVEADLLGWTIQWNRCMREAPFQLVSASDIPFPKRKQISPKEINAFRAVFRFNNLADALDHSICTACMLTLKRAMLDLTEAALARSLSPLLKKELPDIQILMKTITTCADTLCMGLPYLCDSKHGKFGLLVSAPPLGIAMEWYRLLRARTGDKLAAHKLAWCESAAVAIERDGIRMMTTIGQGRRISSL